MIKKKDKILLFISVLAFFLFSISFLLMPTDNSVLTVISGTIFWAMLIIGIVSQIIVSISIRNWKTEKRGKLKRHLKRIGLISFFSNPIATTFDILMIVGVIGFVISMLITQATGYACYIFIAITVLSFSFHCIFNGKNFYYIKNEENLVFSSNREEQK